MTEMLQSYCPFLLPRFLQGVMCIITYIVCYVRLLYRLLRDSFPEIVICFQKNLTKAIYKNRIKITKIQRVRFWSRGQVGRIQRDLVKIYGEIQIKIEVGNVLQPRCDGGWRCVKTVFKASFKKVLSKLPIFVYKIGLKHHQIRGHFLEAPCHRGLFSSFSRYFLFLIL